MKPAKLLILTLCALAAAAQPLNDSADRLAFQRWFTFLAESRCYAHKSLHGEPLVTWAYRQALAKHTRHWYQTLELPLIPTIPAVQQPDCDPPAASGANLLISRDTADAQPGDLLLFADAAPMVYIGLSQVLPSPSRWVVCEEATRTRKVPLESLAATIDNPAFLGVYRLRILTAPEKP